MDHRILPASGHDLKLAGLSLLIAVLASYTAFHSVSSIMGAPLYAAAWCLGPALAGLHFLGMASMRLEAVVKYDPLAFLASVLVAFGLSATALRLLVEDSNGRQSYAGAKFSSTSSAWKRIGSAVILGLSISAMHYAGMRATYFITALNPSAPVAGLDGGVMVLTLAAVAITQSALGQE